MRQLITIIIIAFSILIFSVPVYSANSSKEISENFIAAFKEGSMDKINKILADDVVIEQPFTVKPPGPTVYSGKETVLSYLERVFGTFRSVNFKDIEINIADGETVFVEMKGDIKLSANIDYKNNYVFRLGFVETVDGLKINLIREYFNPVVFLCTLHRPDFKEFCDAIGR